MHLRSISMKGFKSFPDRTKLDFGTGSGRSKKAAEQEAAHAALERMDDTDGEAAA